MQLDFLKKSYGPGDEVFANLELKTLANEVLKSHDLEAIISLSGNDFKTVKGKTDEQGQSKISFRLPHKLDSNEGMLNVRIGYNGQTESIARSIPILLNKIDLQFFPEGGDLIAGFETKIAFKAIDKFGKPADIQGVIVNGAGNQITDFESFHDGMGGFDFSPKPGEKYIAKITKPKGIEENYSLPEIQNRGFSINVKNDSQTDFLNLKINSTERENMTLVVRAADQIQFSRTVFSYEKFLKISTGDLPVGITQITLFDSNNIPRAERLVFVNADKNLNVNIKTDKEKYLPREKISLFVEVTDERGFGVPGQFSLAVADDKLLSYADDKQGHILSSLLLESELKGEIHEPNFYFEQDEKEPAKSRAIALDYLMLTQGWRRFDWEEVLMPPKFAEAKFKGEKAAIAGTVFNEQGKPDTGILVRLEELGLETQTDENGRFSFPDTDFLPNQYQLRVINGKRINFRYFSGLNSDLMLYSGDEKTPVLAPGAGYVSGKILDEETGENLIFATVMLRQNGRLIQGTNTDFDGFYSFQNIEPGEYELEASYTGYSRKNITKFPVKSDKQTALDLTMNSDGMLLESVVVTGLGSPKRKSRKKSAKKANTKLNKGTTLNEIVVTEYKVPVINQDKTTSGGTITAEQIKKLPTRDVSHLASAATGISVADEEDDIQIRDSRNDLNLVLVDGIRVMKEDQILQEEIEAELPMLEEIRAKDLKPKPRHFDAIYNLRSSSLPYNLAFADCARIKNTHQQRACAQAKLNEFIYSNLNYPKTALKNNVSGTVYVNVKIGKNGNVENAYLQQGIGSGCNEEALRIAKSLPDFAVSNTAVNILPRVIRIPIYFNPDGYSSELTTAGFYTPRKFYSPKYESKEAPEVREDFRETIYWNPSVKNGS